MGSKGQTLNEVDKRERAELSIPFLIGRKRDGREFTKEEIQVFVDGVTTNSMEESQIGKSIVQKINLAPVKSNGTLDKIYAP